MELSERERRELADIEGRLERENIELAKQLRTMSPERRERPAWRALALMLAVVALVLVVVVAGGGGRSLPQQHSDIHPVGYTRTPLGFLWFPPNY